MLIPSGNVTLNPTQYSNVYIQLGGTISAGTTSTVVLPNGNTGFWVFVIDDVSFGSDNSGRLEFTSGGVTVSCSGSDLRAGSFNAQTAVAIGQLTSGFLIRIS